jgi:hypothetical protein
MRRRSSFSSAFFVTRDTAHPSTTLLAQLSVTRDFFDAVTRPPASEADAEDECVVEEPTELCRLLSSLSVKFENFRCHSPSWSS